MSRHSSIHPSGADSAHAPRGVIRRILLSWCAPPPFPAQPAGLRDRRRPVPHVRCNDVGDRFQRLEVQEGVLLADRRATQTALKELGLGDKVEEKKAE